MTLRSKMKNSEAKKFLQRQGRMLTRQEGSFRAAYFGELGRNPEFISFPLHLPKAALEPTAQG
jgi:hypothetical protein